MDIQITGKDFSLTESLQTYVNEHAAKLLHLNADILRMEFILDMERHHQKGEKFVAEGIIVIPGNDISATARAVDMRVAIDLLIPKLATQLRKGKDRTLDRRRAP